MKHSQPGTTKTRPTPACMPTRRRPVAPLTPEARDALHRCETAIAGWEQ